MAVKVLVVDDDPDISAAEAAALDVAGYEPVCARTGREALERLRDPEPPRVILLDYQMPGMNGEQFRAEQRKQPAFASIPVVMVSADPAAPDAAARLRLAFLAKPFDADTLVDVVRRSASGR